MARQFGPGKGLLKEVLAGVIVCFAQIPESVAFANMANCPPALGIQAAWIVGLICGLFGGRPGMINGSAGALAAVTANFVSKRVDAQGHTVYHGLVQLFLSVILAALLIIVGAAFKVGKFLCLIPATVVIGFCNGLGWVIGRAQLSWFQDAQGNYLEQGVLIFCLLECFITFFIMQGMLSSKRARSMPAALVAVVVATAFEFGLVRGVLKMQTPTIGDKSPFDSHQTVPQIFLLSRDYDLSKWGSFKGVLHQGITLAVVATLESLLCLEVVNDLTRTVGDPNKQLWALGFANLAGGILGTMGGNSLIELCVMNVQSGGRFRTSSVVCALGILIVFVIGHELLNYIPVASLAGVMVAVVIGFVRWTSIPAVVSAAIPRRFLEPSAGTSRGAVRKYLWSVRIGGYDAFLIIIVTVLTALSNLAVSIAVGTALSAMRFAYQQTKPVEIQTSLASDGMKVYTLKGPIFFGARHRLIDAFTPETDPPMIEIDFGGAEIFDFAIMQELHPILGRYGDLQKSVRIRNLEDANHLPALLRFATTEDGHNASIISHRSCGASCPVENTNQSHLMQP
eukprot:TRINITY_DN80920_c0_g1_i1.p1 TRINITY_DN80920_c0_g1~~TRINITY_DN80920_c0_g1_i1.p1  ORF type:complete len:567 (+),score=86.65 TRINITY_DN80920_c0_g1_i1:88-1788(+)